MKQRIIKFKAKERGIGDWVNGDLLHHGNKCYIGIHNVGHNIIANVPLEVDPSTICQFTGLKDGKGKDVYENDILEHINNTDIKVCIEWREHRYVLKEVGKGILHLALQRTLDDLVVIGNKFDRKEEK